VNVVRGLGIRQRLVASIVVLLSLVLVGAGVLVTSTLRDRLVDNVDEQLDQRVVAVTRFLARNNGLPGGPRVANPFNEQRAAYVELDADGRVVGSIALEQGGRTEPLPDVSGRRLGSSPRTVGAVGEGGPRYRVVAIDVGDHTVVAGMSLADVDASLRSARQVLLLGGLLVIAAAAAVVWATVRQGLRPIDGMITTAERIAAGDLTERTPVPDPNTEVGHLGTALNTMLDHIETAMGAKSASEARLRRFVADASHELRTPLTSIRGYAELYRQGATDSDAVALGMARIEREATRMGELVEDLLLLARLDQGQQLRREPVDLAAVVDDAVEAAKVVEPDRRIVVGRPDMPVVVEGDVARLRQVLDNLLANAREHTGAGTQVTVTVTDDPDAARVVIADDGPGMSDGDAERAFERFWQGESTLEHPRKGTGLGLAIVHDIVSGHGGTVDLVTAPGRGASFTITLPRHGFRGDSQGTDSPAQGTTVRVEP
jgi:two-component system OmpR family sensor kinase